MHITASVFINNNEQGLLRDFQEWLEKLAPKNFDYKHHQTGENNGYAYIWRTLMEGKVLFQLQTMIWILELGKKFFMENLTDREIKEF